MNAIEHLIEENVIQRIQNAARFVDKNPAGALQLLVMAAFQFNAAAGDGDKMPAIWRETMMKVLKNREQLTPEDVKMTGSVIKICQKQKTL